MKKAALLTIFRVPNYGSVLQAFASLQVLKSLGFEPLLIDYLYPNEWHFAHGTPRYRKSLLKRVLIPLLGHLGLKKGYRQRKHLEAFIASNMPVSASFPSLDALNEHDWSTYSLIIAGSDQIWNPRYQYGDSAFMLSFVPEELPRISLSSSFAQKSLPRELVEKYREHLSKFAGFTVRENAGLDIIRYQLALTPPSAVALDPTLLLSARDWESLLHLPAPNPSRKKYLLLYFLHYAFDPAPYIYNVVEYLSHKHHLEVKVICGEQNNAVRGHLSTYQDCSGVSVEEFVRLMRDAEIVVTSSFHGTAFAVNFGRPLVAIVPDSDDDRQHSLLHNLGIGHCATHIGADLSRLDPYYDPRREQLRLTALRDESITFLKNITGQA